MLYTKLDETDKHPHLPASRVWTVHSVINRGRARAETITSDLSDGSEPPACCADRRMAADR